ncbi:unnamed protein product [Lampetra planeri]
METNHAVGASQGDWAGSTAAEVEKAATRRPGGQRSVEGDKVQAATLNGRRRAVEDAWRPEGEEREVTETESEQALASQTMEDRSGGMARQGTPQQDDREEWEMSSEEGETSTSRREESPKDT